MNKRQVLAAILAGEIPAAVARVQLRGLRFWAMQDDGGGWDVEIRQHGKLLSRARVSVAELAELRPKCVSWTAISEDKSEFCHDGNRGQWPYE
jgi:hypothetical protein